MFYHEENQQQRQTLQEFTCSIQTALEDGRYTAEHQFKTAKAILENQEVKFTTADIVELSKVLAQNFHTSIMAIKVQEIRKEITKVKQQVRYIQENM